MGITKTSILIFFFVLKISYSQQINWMSLDEALTAQKIEPKKIIMDVYTKWCGPCRLLDRKTFGIQMSLDIFLKIFMLLNLMQKVTKKYFFTTKNSITQITTRIGKVEIQLMISPSF